MIEVKGLSKHYRSIKAVDNISFHVEKGDIVGFLGPNGAGKTTTMRMLTCFIPPTSGQASVAGYDIIKQPMEVKKNIGYLPENPPVYKDMVVTSYLEFAGKIRGLTGNNLKKRLDYVVERCGIKEVKKRLVGNLSKGYRQRVGLAQALIHDPKVLILDEPTIGLDPKQITDIRSLIKELGGERTIILSTHILPEVTMTCNKVIIINKGKIAATDKQENLSRNVIGCEKVFVLLSNPPTSFENEIASALKGIISVKKDENDSNGFVIETERDIDIREDLTRYCYERNYGIKEIKRISASLEDIFINLVTTEKEQ